MSNERHVALEVHNGTQQAVLLRCYRNFQTWYVLEVSIWREGKLVTLEQDYYDVDRAFNAFERYESKITEGEIK